MLPDPGPPTYESGALPIALRGPGSTNGKIEFNIEIEKYKTLDSFGEHIYSSAH